MTQDEQDAQSHLDAREIVGQIIRVRGGLDGDSHYAGAFYLTVQGVQDRMVALTLGAQQALHLVLAEAAAAGVDCDGLLQRVALRLAADD